MVLRKRKLFALRNLPPPPALRQHQAVLVARSLTS